MLEKKVILNENEVNFAYGLSRADIFPIGPSRLRQTEVCEFVPGATFTACDRQRYSSPAGGLH